MSRMQTKEASNIKTCFKSHLFFKIIGPALIKNHQYFSISLLVKLQNNDKMLSYIYIYIHIYIYAYHYLK